MYQPFGLWFTALGALTCVAASPIINTDSELILPRRASDEKIKDASEKFKGVYWDIAAETCSEEQFDILVEATRVAVQVAEYHPNMQVSPGWNEFFLISREWDEKYRAIGLGATFYHQQLANWIVKGPSEPPGKKPGWTPKRQHKITYHCGDPELYSKCRNNNVPAYTPTQPTRILNYEQSMNVVFCNRMWDGRIQYINAMKGTQDRLGDLVSYEHVLIHEWSHNLGFELGHITDVEDYASSDSQRVVDIYGAYYCHEYAWKYVKSGQDKWNRPVNKETLKNADNHAWMYSYNFFSKKFGWDDWNALDIEEKTTYKEDPEDNAEGLESENPAGLEERLNDNPPKECPDADNCQYVGGSFFTNDLCLLSLDCRIPDENGNVSPYCVCTCDGEEVDNLDSKCDSPLRFPRPKEPVSTPPVTGDVPDPTPPPDAPGTPVARAIITPVPVGN